MYGSAQLWLRELDHPVKLGIGGKGRDIVSEGVRNDKPCSRRLLLGLPRITVRSRVDIHAWGQKNDSWRREPCETLRVEALERHWHAAAHGWHALNGLEVCRRSVKSEGRNDPAGDRRQHPGAHTNHRQRRSRAEAEVPEAAVASRQPGWFWTLSYFFWRTFPCVSAGLRYGLACMYTSQNISISTLSPLAQSRGHAVVLGIDHLQTLLHACAPGCRGNTLRGGKCVGHLQAVCRRQPLPAVPGPLLICWGSRLKERLRLGASQAARGERLSGSWQVGCRPERTLSARRSLLLEQHHRGGWRHAPVRVSTSNQHGHP